MVLKLLPNEVINDHLYAKHSMTATIAQPLK